MMHGITSLKSLSYHYQLHIKMESTNRILAFKSKFKKRPKNVNNAKRGKAGNAIQYSQAHGDPLIMRRVKVSNL
jgi:hypothetical protein